MTTRTIKYLPWPALASLGAALDVSMRQLRALLPGMSESWARVQDRRLTLAQAQAVAPAASPADIAQLLSTAAQYQAIQPGYAADLRAAAERAGVPARG